MAPKQGTIGDADRAKSRRAVSSTTCIYFDMELCGLPHAAGAVTCDGCDHVLGESVNVGRMRDELALRKKQIFASVVLILSMIVLNLEFFGRAGFIVVVAPFAWALHCMIGNRAIAHFLASRKPAG